MLKDLFESLDKTIFTDELRNSIETSIKDKIEEEKSKLIENMQIEFNNDIEKYKEDLYEEFKKDLEVLVAEKSLEKIQEKEDSLQEEFNNDIESFKEELVNTLDKVVDRVVEEFLEESSEKLDNSIKNERVGMLKEAANAMLMAAGLDKIDTEFIDESAIDSRYDELNERYNKLFNDYLELEKVNENLLKTGLINEMKEGLTLMQCDKFEKLAEMVEFSIDSNYVEKLETIKESILDNEEKNSEFENKSDSEETKVEESKNIDESAKKQDNMFNWSHLI